MKAVLIFFALSCLAVAEAPLPETTLKKWGYEVTEVDAKKKYYRIRSHKNFGDSKEKFYARYVMWKEDFDSEVDAQKRIKEFESRPEREKFKNYTQVVQSGKRLIFFGATSMKIAAEDQPNLHKRIIKYAKARAKPE